MAALPFRVLSTSPKLLSPIKSQRVNFVLSPRLLMVILNSISLRADQPPAGCGVTAHSPLSLAVQAVEGTAGKIESSRFSRSWLSKVVSLYSRGRGRAGGDLMVRGWGNLKGVEQLLL